MTRQRKALYLFIALAVLIALLVAKIVAEVHRGEQIFWLAELWAPAAALSIGLVTGIEFLIPGEAEKIQAKAPVAAPGVVATPLVAPKAAKRVKIARPAPVATKAKKSASPAAPRSSRA